jgi:hypothetical protein
MSVIFCDSGVTVLAAGLLVPAVVSSLDPQETSAAAANAITANRVRRCREVDLIGGDPFVSSAEKDCRSCLNLP